MKLIDTMKENENMGWCKPYLSAFGYQMVVCEGEVIQASEEDWIGEDASDPRFREALAEYHLTEFGCKDCPWREECDAVNEEIKKVASVKDYSGNCRVFVDGDSIEISYDGFEDYTTEENMEGIKEILTGKFGDLSEISNMDDVLAHIEIDVDCLSKRAIKHPSEYASNREIIEVIENSSSYDEVQKLAEYLCKHYEIDMKNELGEWKNGDEILEEIKEAARKNQDI